MNGLREFVEDVMLPTFAPVKPEDMRSMAELHLGKKIVTSHVYPPIPIRSWDWCAYPDGEEELGHYGWGATEAEAVEELIISLRDIQERIP